MCYGEDSVCFIYAELIIYVSYPVFPGLAFVLLGMQVKGSEQQIGLLSEEVLC